MNKIVSMGSLNALRPRWTDLARDPRAWTDPEMFDLDRVISGHVGFGFGIHQCLGQMVARLEGEMVLTALLERLREIRLAGEPRRRLNNTLHAIESLPIEVVPH